MSFMLTLPGGRQTPYSVYGNPDGIPLVFMGPGSIYRPMLPESLMERFRVYVVDGYWTNSASAATIPVFTPEEISSLTVEKFIADFNEIVVSLGIGKVVAIAPSAVGLMAMEWGRLHPENAFGVVCLGAPLTLKNITIEEFSYFVANYYPGAWDVTPRTSLGEVVSLYGNGMFRKDTKLPAFLEERLKHYTAHPRSSADRAVNAEWEKTLGSEDSKWERFAKHVQQHEGAVRIGMGTIEGYDAEIHRDEESYYHDGSPSFVYKAWEDFSMGVRGGFFRAAFAYDFSHISETSVPIFDALGLYDGMAPFYMTTDSKHRPPNFTCPVFERSAHTAHLEEPGRFSTALVGWTDEHIVPQMRASLGPSPSS